ncbi:MAG: pentapeptide repeat-containing protein [Candidatus Omnitrophica bacterium]|nr:pentapeptide repeat-containing protein [Candidatus Omnitrophota bacterium]
MHTQEKISIIGNELSCADPSCKEKALSLSRFCWKHTADKSQYTDKLKNFLTNGSGENFILKKVVLQNSELIKVNLKNADLSQADFKNTNLFYSDISNANLIGCNLEGADLTGIDLKYSDLTRANMKRARLWHADLSYSNTSEADLREADLWKCRLYSARLWHTELRDVKSLTMHNFARPTRSFLSKVDEKIDEKGVLSAEESYRDLKKYFTENGRYQDASWASFKEKIMEKCWLIKNKNLAYLPHAIMGMLCGYGEKPNRIVVSSLAILVFYGIGYYLLKAITPSYTAAGNYSLADCIYYSIITFTTLGYGDFIPKENIYYRLLAGSEAFIGAFMMGLFVFTLSRKYSAR